jgi:hypothetical protein
MPGKSFKSPTSSRQTRRPKSPLLFVNVASKGLTLSVSGLESTLVGGHISVASKEVVCTKMAQNAVCFVNVADRGLRPKLRLPKAKTPAGVLASRGSRSVITQPTLYVRGILFVKGKSEKPWRWAADWRSKSQNPHP